MSLLQCAIIANLLDIIKLASMLLPTLSLIGQLDVLHRAPALLLVAAENMSQYSVTLC